MRVSNAGWRIVGAGTVAVALAACGGGGGSEEAVGLSTAQSAGEPDSSESDTGSVPSLERTAEILLEGAQLNSEALEAAAVVDEAVAANGKSNTIAAGEKSFAGRIQAYRFYNTQTGAHFYTVSAAERDLIRSTLPQFAYEGPAFFASGVAAPGLSQVHRFYNVQTGVHFFTINETERATIVRTLPQFRYEGVAYYASRTTGAGLTPLYRFYVTNRGFHFYSNSLAETNSIRSNPALANYQYEGVGYHVLSTSYAGRMVVLPHTGVPSTRCYSSSGNGLFDCSSAQGQSLYLQQDGHRESINPAMSYSELPAPAGGTYPRTECVRDNVTGLVWEGKNASLTEPRPGGGTYSYASTTSYINYVNSIALCGYNNWRLPTLPELHSLVDYGKTTMPRIDMDWFPNHTNGIYWTSSPNPRLLNSSRTVSFTYGRTDAGLHTSLLYIRLVRHEP